ncbi:glycosyltransferase family 2 protein [Christiangramia marina]|uniref:glycosyltransferase family 2 protein n=1 Tax=Christiangramia marina TaxID=409436 RepID=UPI003AA7FFC4
MEHALVSIIIPTYNRAHLIGETLDSILSQTYKHWECIVVDDGSTDYTKELMEFYCGKDSRISFHHRPQERTKGANACRNYGFELSSGEFVKWFDSDDLMHINYVKKVQSFLNTKLELDLIITNAVYFSEDTSHPDRIFKNKCTPENLLLDYLTSKIFINTQVTLWRRNVLSEYQFNENLFKAQELDFHFRILKNQNLNVEFIDEELVYIRNHQDSITGSYKQGGHLQLFSELMVRRNIIQYLFEKNVHVNIKKASFRFYLLAISHLYKFRPINEVFQELKQLENSLGINQLSKLWKFKLFQFLIIYKLSNRDYRLGNHLKGLLTIIDND